MSHGAPDQFICVTSGEAKATARPSTAQKRTRSAVRNRAMIENNAMANPMQLRMSTRNKSVQGAGRPKIQS